MSSRRIVIREGAAALAADFIPSEAESAAAAEAEDLASVSGFASASRRAERLAWRKLLREVLAEYFGCAFPEGLRIEYSASGAPRLKDFPDMEISVSHCRDMAAVDVSHTVAPAESRCDDGGACGVDIERADRNFDRATSRYLSPAERALSSDPRLPAAVWCAKECLFKMQGREGLDLLRDIVVTGIDFTAGTVAGHIVGHREVAMRMLFPDEKHLIIFRI